MDALENNKICLRRLRSLRKEAGVTQRQVAAHLGLNQGTYSAMERGSQKILADYLPEIAKAIGIPIWQIFMDAGEVGVLIGEDQAFFHMWKKLDSSEQTLIQGMIEQIMQKKELEKLVQSPLLPPEVLQHSNDPQSGSHSPVH